MKKIEEMISRLCPEGVERVPLWSVTVWDKKFNAVDKSMQPNIIKYKYLLANELNELVNEEGDVRILYTNKDVAFTTEELAKDYISSGEIVAIPWGGTPSVKYYNGKFVTGDNRIATSIDVNKLDNKYMYYWMESELEAITSFYRGAGIKHPSMYSVLTMEIPLPHPDIQKEIVLILDNFTSLQDNLEEELKLRQKQYEYYREKLLTFEEGECEWKYIRDFSSILRGKRLTKKMLSDSNTYPVYHGGIEPIGYYTESNRPAYTVMVINVGASAGTVGFCNEEFWSSDGCFCLNKTEELDDKFLYYSLKIRENEIMSKVRTAGIPTLDNKIVENIILPIPSISRQQEIVNTLDKFEAMIANIKEEIEQRKKQYEYYREKLLTF